MKLKDLVNKEFEVTFSDRMILFTEEDVERAGEDYEINENTLRDRMERVLYNEEVNILNSFKSSIKLVDNNYGR